METDMNENTGEVGSTIHRSGRDDLAQRMAGYGSCAPPGPFSM